MKCGKLNGGGCMRVSIASYSCRKPGHMMKDCPYVSGQEKGKEKVQPNGPSEVAPMGQQFFALKSRGIREDLSGDVFGA